VTAAATQLGPVLVLVEAMVVSPLVVCGCSVLVVLRCGKNCRPGGRRIWVAGDGAQGIQGRNVLPVVALGLDGGGCSLERSGRAVLVTRLRHKYRFSAVLPPRTPVAGAACWWRRAQHACRCWPRRACITHQNNPASHRRAWVGSQIWPSARTTQACL